MTCSLDQLPVLGIESPVQTVLDVRTRLVITSNILEELLRMPQGLSSDLREALLNIRYHVTAAQSFIAAFLDLGGTVGQSHLEVQGLQDSLDLHLGAIEAARGPWTRWLADEYHEGLPSTKPLPQLSRGVGIANTLSYFLPAVGPALVRPRVQPQNLGALIDDVSKPMALTDYLAMGAVALAAVLFIRAGK